MPQKNGLGDNKVRFFANDNSTISVTDVRIVNRCTAGEIADTVYLVLDYSTQNAWIEEGTSAFYAPEAEDGAGNFWLIEDEEPLLDIKKFFEGCNLLLSSEMSRPGSASRDIQRYCARFSSSR
ncbi:MULTISPECIES: hypothetical protein [unclassified Sphingomonas]|uniref:hypothetical protein n=1 Tax=Sphingomonas sp. PvP015 TaxID=3156388 RepID=UPI0033974CFA